MCSGILVILGIIALANGRFSLARWRIVRGTPARLIGLLFILSFPVNLAVGVGVGLWLVNQRGSISDAALDNYGFFLDIIVGTFCVVTAVIVAIIWGGPPVLPAPPAEKNEHKKSDWRLPEIKSRDDTTHRRTDEEFREYKVDPPST